VVFCSPCTPPMSTIHSIAKALRPLTICRRLSSLRSSQRLGPRGSIGRRQPPAGIPDNATRASAALRPEPIAEVPDNSYNSLSTPVYIPEDQGAVITTRHPAAKILQNSALIVERQWEVGNILLCVSGLYISMERDCYSRWRQRLRTSE
jgi:hypothetical protein